MPPRSRANGFTALCAVLAFACVILAATRPDVSGAHDGEALALAVVWLVAAVFTAWHVVGVAVCLAARAWPTWRGPQRCLAWTPRLVRRAVGVAWGASVLLSPALAHAQTADEPVVRAPVRVVTTTTSAPATTTTSTTATPSTTVSTTPPAAAAIDAAPPDAPAPAPVVVRNHVVAEGENLWKIAAAELAPLGRTSTSEIAAYWRVVVDANRDTLRSGNPSLIFPGEVIVLPPSG